MSCWTTIYGIVYGYARTYEVEESQGRLSDVTEWTFIYDEVACGIAYAYMILSYSAQRSQINDIAGLARPW